MKNLFTILFVLASIAGYSQKVTNTWNGNFNSYWHNNGNWSLGHIPTATEDVVIPNGMSRYPSVDYNDEEINSLTIHSAAEVRIYDHIFEITGDVAIYGALKILHEDARLECNNITWESGSEAQTTGNCDIMVFGTWEFKAGANVQLEEGRAWFYGSNNQYIRSKEADCYFNDVYVQKDAGVFALSAQSSASCKIKGYLTLAGANYDVLSYANETIQIGKYFQNSNPDINVALENGTIEITDYPSNFMFKPQAGDYINNLVVNAGNYELDLSTTYTNTFEIKGDVTINSGQLDANGMNLLVGGDWENNVGLSGFVERDEKVTFNGSGHQYCSDETFYTLEINKPSGALRIQGSDVVCAEYDWTDGAIDVLSGSFTANELLDAGIAGEWYVNDEVHIHQNVGYIDLLGDLHIFDGGYMHVYGGSDDSWWPYGASGSHFEIESGGALKFHDVGINIRPTGTLTTNINGGWVGMAGNFKVDRADFSAPSLVWGMQGIADASLEIDQGYIYQVDVAKIDSKTNAENLNNYKNIAGRTPESTTISNPEKYYNNNYVSKGIYTTGFTARDGKVYTPTRSNTVSVAGNLNVNHMHIYAGTFDINGHTANLPGEMFIFNGGILKMTNPLDELNLRDLEWRSGSADLITNGEINVSGNWTFENGTESHLDSDNTVRFVGGGSSSIYNYDEDAFFGSISLQKNTGSSIYLDELSTNPIYCVSDFSIENNNNLYPQTETLIVDGTLDIQYGSTIYLEDAGGQLINNSGMNLAGKIEVMDGCEALIDGDFTVATSGELIIGGGEFTVISDVWTAIYGSLTMTAGVFELQNSLEVKASADVNISGGTIRIEHLFDAREPNTFQPVGGTVEFFGSTHGGFYCNNGNYLYNLKINKAPSHGAYIGLNTHVLNNLIIDGGVFKVKYSDNPKNIELGGDVEVNEGGVLWFDEYVHVSMANGSNINVNDGGTLQFSGLPDGNALLTSTAGTYNLNVWPGGVMVAEYTTFEKMTTDGIHFHTGSMIDPASPFSHCTFQAGAPGGTMLTMNNEQEVTMEEVSFYSDGLETYNVSKTNDQGSITFVDFNGDFAGAEYENDPYNRIHWFEPELSVTPSVLNVPANAGSALLNLEANVSWQISNTYDWLTVNPMSGSGDNTLVMNFDENTSLESRTATCIVSGDDVPDVEFTITQAGMDPLLTVTPANRNVSAEAGMTTFNLVTNTPWTVSESLDWLTVNPTAGNNSKTLVVDYLENTSLTPRISEIIVSGVDVPDVTVTVTQSGAIPILQVTPANRDVSAAAGNTTFDLISNTSWTVSESLDWLSVGPAAGSNNATLTVDYLENTSITPRIGNITISASGATDVIATVSQAGANLALQVTPANRDVSAAAGNTTFDLISNTSWTVSESLEWLSVGPAAGSNNATLTVDYLENTSITSRTGNITISASGTPNVIVTITQAGVNNQLSVSPSNQLVGIMPGTTTFDIMSNTSWTVTESVSWLSTNLLNGAGDAVLNVSYQGNYTSIDRVGEITITTDNKLAVTVTVTQPGISPTLAVDPEALFFLSPNGIGFLNVYSNTNWTITDNMDWVGLNYEFPSGNVEVIVSVQMNFTGMERSGEITVETEDGSIQIVIPVTQGYFVEHTISLPAGWSGLSSYVLPTPPFIDDVFSGISDELIIALTGEEIYYPEYGINTIGMWEAFSGYKIKTDAAVDLEIYGSSYPDKTMAIPSGWSLLPVISQCPVDVEDLFAPIIANIEIVKEVAGYGIYWPAMGINTLGTLNPGKAYYVLSNAVVEITFDDCGKTVTSETLTGFDTLSELITWKKPKLTPSSHSIALLPGAIQNFEKGSNIGAFDAQGNCFGATALNANANAITIFGDDELTAEKDGFNTEDQIIFKLFLPSTKEEIELFPEFDLNLPDADGVFVENGLSAITAFKAGSTDIAGQGTENIRIYPNPSNGTFEISGLPAGAEINITDVHGQLVFSARSTAGIQQRIDLQNCNPGIYMIGIIRHGILSYHKMVVR